MERNEAQKILGRKIRLAVIGGGPGSFIGGIHRMAARIDDQYEIVSAVLSSNPQKSVALGQEIGLNKNRSYGTVLEMLESEKLRDDGAEVVAIMTPNNSHYDYSILALDRGYHVICDKPLTNTVDDAKKLFKKVKESGLKFCLTHNYTGYPMIRQARSMVRKRDLGDIRLVQVEYVQGGKAKRTDTEINGGARSWKFDPEIAGPSAVLGDIGTHAHNLVRFITGLEVTEVCAEVGAIVPEREIHDFAGALLRFNNGARGSFWVTQAAAGVENSLKIRVSGSKGTIEWLQEHPQILTFKSLDAPSQVFTPNGPGTYPLATNSSRIVKGHPEGFPEAFANLYCDFAEVVAAYIKKTDVNPLATHYPKVGDGLAGVLFIEAALRSSKNSGSWEKVL